MNQTSKEKANTLLKIIGVGDELYKLEQDEQSTYNQRLTIGRIADQKAKYAKEMPVYEGVPTEPVSASALIKQQQEILAKMAKINARENKRNIMTMNLHKHK